MTKQKAENRKQMTDIKKQITEYNPNRIEKKWQSVWEKEKTFSPDLINAKKPHFAREASRGKPYYTLMMFPYPSAEGLHVGNMYAFTGADVHGRYSRMTGFDVFEPIGLDGFGIHSENYAVKTGRHPVEQAKLSETNFYRQLRSTGNGYDWTRTLETYDPDYYRWTQWLFVQMFKSGLAYRKKAQVNWCPSDKTVLADEQVIDGKCERDGALVEKRDLEQWFFRITDYADQLLDGLTLIDWPEKIKTAQRQWIGKKTGINITYNVENSKEKIKVFTTRPDTNFGATFIALAPENPLVLKITTPENKKDIERYIEVSKKKTDFERKEEGKEKTGVFTGAYAINDLTGYKMPIWVSDFVLMEFGTGALVGVPGHDKRDFEFAKKFGLEVIRVVVGNDGDSSKIEKIEQVQEEEGSMINSGFLDGMDIGKATEKIMDYMEEKGYGKRESSYHLRDWLISRQRYWGPPIPIIYCRNCWENREAVKGDDARIEERSRKTSLDNDTSFETIKRQTLIEGVDYAIIDGKEHIIHAVPEEDLPVMLPDVEDWRPEGSGTSPLANHPEFYETTCPSCNKKAKRETDVSDTFLDSAWYYLRYLSIGNDDSGRTISKSIKKDHSLEIRNSKLEIPYEPELVNRWCPVAIYIGGAEHSVLHLLYVRFIAMVLHNLKSDARNFALPFTEPFPRFFAHGLIVKDGAKMSKSKGNVVIPDKYIEKFGADTLRLYLMFLGPFSQGGDFRDSGIEGMNRFVRRVWTLLTKQLTIDKLTIDRLRFMHKTIKGVTEDIESFSYNTAIAKMMEYYNFLSDKLTTDNGQLTTDEATTFLKLMAPFAPHMTEELWEKLSTVYGIQSTAVDSSQWTESIHFAPWPTFDPQYIVEDEVVIPVQVNGKRRGEITIDNLQLTTDKLVEERAREAVAKYLEGKTVRKVIYVPGKIINFVV